MSEAPAKPRRRRWVRLLRGLLLFGVLLLLATAGGVWWAYAKRLELLNKALATAGPVQGKASAFEVDRHGAIEVRELVFTDKASGQTLLRLPRLTAQAKLGALPPREITSVKLHEPEIMLSATMLEAWSRQSAKPAAGTASTSRLPGGLRIGKADIEKARIRFEQPDATCAEITLTYHAEDLQVNANGLDSGQQELLIEDAALRPKDGAVPPFALKKLSAKGRMRGGMVELEHLALNGPGLALSPELLALFGWRKPSPGAADASSPKVEAVTAPAAPPLVQGVRIAHLELNGLRVQVQGFQPGNVTGLHLPDAQATLSYEARDIEWRPGEVPTFGSQRLAMRETTIEAPGGAGHVRVSRADLVLGAWRDGQPWTVEQVSLDQPEIRWTPALAAFLGKAEAETAAPSPKPEAPAAAAPTKPATPLVIVKRGSLMRADVLLADAALIPFELRTQGALMLADLTIATDGLRSGSFQTLEVTNTSLAFPAADGKPAPSPFFELPRGELVVKPDDWNAGMRLARLLLDKPVLRMREGNTPWLAAAKGEATGQKGEAASAAPAPAEPAAVTVNSEGKAKNDPPWWQKLHFGQLTLKDGSADVLLEAPKPVDLQGRIDIQTQRLEDGGSQHRVRLTGLSGKLPTLTAHPFPVLQSEEIEASVRVPHVWQSRRIEELHVRGTSMELGEALLRLFETEEKKEEAAKAATEVITLQGSTPKDPRQVWRVGHLSVQDSSVSIANLVPGLPSVKFGVAFDVEDAPLLAEDLVDDIAPQRIELHDLKIPSPHGTARYVAELDSIFLTFSLGGLMRKEIDGIEIVSPTLFVGEDLFWYVDFYRKYAERGAHPAPNAPQIAAEDDEIEFDLARAVVEAEPPLSQASWSVKRLQVHSGKLVLAPKGIPLKGFTTPFPFQIDTEVTRGNLHADLDIPTGTYELPSVELKFIGMKGRVQFNLPIKQKDNNLTETFEVDSIRWKNLKTGKAFLSITYDTAGIYAQFGAEAYEGYVNGQVNIYTDDSFHWDGWLGGKNIQTRDLTRILCPGYFLMEGRVEATLVAQGSAEELYQADASFENHTPGRFSVSALNDMINDLPQSLDPLKAQITKIGLETLRDFEYDRASMKCRFYGREGTGRLSFTGPTGSRNFDINVLDHRWKAEGPELILSE